MFVLCTLDFGVEEREERAELAVWVHLSLQHGTVVLDSAPRRCKSVEAGGRSPIDCREVWIFSQEFTSEDKFFELGPI